MSLTSLELNYLIWRYLQESGFELAAYALQKGSHCLEYEHKENKFLPSIEPGCLVNLVQKGILYTLIEDSVSGKNEKLSLINAIIKDNENQQAINDYNDSQKFLSKTEVNNNKQNGTTDTDVKMADADEQNTDEESDTEDNIEFKTLSLKPHNSLSSSLSAEWNPTAPILAYGKENSSAVITAIDENNQLSETTLAHPPIINSNDNSTKPDEIITISWAPSGSMLLTSGLLGEIRAWTTDGRLKNIVNSVSEPGASLSALQNVIWSPRGQLVITIDTGGTVSVREGSSLALIRSLKDADAVGVFLDACWVSDTKFALTTPKNGIKIYSVNLQVPFDTSESVVPIGNLAGHSNPISGMEFSSVSRLLASASDEDYLIKIWNSQSSRDALELNVSDQEESTVNKHTSPIIGLHWLQRRGDIQGNELLSISMEGVVNVWDTFSGDLILSSNIFKSPESYHFDHENDTETENPLIFVTAVSEDSKFLAVGDDSGTVTIWDINTRRYKKKSNILRCLGIYEFRRTEESKQETGICDLAWDKVGKHIMVCFKANNSVILEWPGLEKQ